MARSSASPSWSRLPIEPEAERVRPEAREFADALRSRATAALPRGAGRTYGDSAANSGGALLETGRLSRVISFDAERGRITVEAGVTLAEIHRRTLPSGWVVPCCPGTAAVTVGGMIAHDVHGKNHHATGTLGLHVRSLVLLRSEGEVTCSAAAAPELLRATIGGLGLTGTVMEAELQLQRVPGALVEVTRERHGSLGAAVAALDELGPGDHGYAWVDG
ncbi:MAG: FAD-binding oxidoreductase, partial [Planctomycetota bacterium]|nr:FAD-binding oxidoreductase [Planctomycetota bacterium]